MNSISNINAAPVATQTKIQSRLDQAITAANLKAITESVSFSMLNKKFSVQTGGTFDIAYEAEIKLTPKGLSSFVADPAITFHPNDTEKHKHLLEDGNDAGEINLSYVTKFSSDCKEPSNKTELEKSIEHILNFVEDEIQPEICKYLHQAKRKNGFTKSVKKNGGKNTEKAMLVMNSAISILKEKLNIQI